MNISTLKAARYAEALILAVVGYLMLWLMAASTSVGGYMRQLDSLGQTYRLIYVGAFIFAAGFAAVAVHQAMKGRHAAGTLIMAAVLTVYALLLNAGHYPLQGLMPERLAEANDSYSLLVSGADAPGTEVWMNGVKVGTLPLRTTVGELRERVPHWTAAPADFETDVARVWVGGGFQDDAKRWAKLELPRPYHYVAPAWPATQPSVATTDTCYLRVRYGDEWGCFTGGVGSGGQSGGLAGFSYAITQARFPHREERLRELLNQLRLRDYCVDDSWAQALGTFGSEGWVAIRKLIPTEPAMSEVFDALARRQQQLPPNPDEAHAVAAFDRICREADHARCYRTDDLTGRAVELISAQLPVDPLIAQARTALGDAAYLTYCTWSFSDRPQFGTFQQASVNLIPGAEGQTTSVGTGGNGATFPPSAVVVAHALCTIAAEATPRGQACRDLIARQIVPEVVRQHGLTANLAKALLSYGATPDVVWYFQRQFFKTHDSKEWGDHLGGGGNGANRWLFYLAVTASPEAARFREMEPSAMTDLADSILTDSWHPGTLAERVDFLFQTPKTALAYWPRFCQVAAKEAHAFDKLAEPWRYLNRLGDLATPDMYVDAAVQTVPNRPDLDEGMRVLSVLPAEKRTRVLDALATRLSKERVPLHADFYEGRQQFLDEARRGLTAAAPGYHATQNAAYEVERLSEHPNAERMQRVRSLAEAQPESCLVEMLARHAQPELRKLALVGIRHYTTAARRELLQRLMSDPDAGVQQAALVLSAELEEMRKADPRRFSSLPPSAQTAGAGRAD